MYDEFEWDAAKERINQRKHRISFADGVLVFDDPNCIYEFSRNKTARTAGWPSEWRGRRCS